MKFLKRRGFARGFAVIILILLAFYMALPALSLGSRQQRQYQYSTAEETPIDASAVLGVLTQSTNLTELNRLRDLLQLVVKLPGAVELPVSSDDPLLEYLATLENVTDKMTQIDNKLHHAENALSAGHKSEARADLAQLYHLRAETRPLIRQLYELLDRVADDYEIDTSLQSQKLDEVNALFKNYSHKIDALSTRIGPIQQLISTTLTLNASKLEVYVEETFFVYGQLRAENGTALVGRNVTVSTGGNQAIQRLTDFAGGFNISVSYPVGTVGGLAELRANFEPEGADASVFLPALATTEVLVEYYPSFITAQVVPSSARPTELVVVNGILTSETGVPLQGRTVTITLDQTFLGNTTTGVTGQFSFGFSVPTSASNGTHVLNARFDPTNDRFASTDTSLSLIVELIATHVLINVDRSSVLSGTSLTVNGGVTYDNGTVSNRGNLTVFVDGQPFLTKAANGTFRFEIQLSLGLGFGSHSIQVTFTPSDSWVQASSAARQVYVFNTPLIVVVAVGVATISAAGYSIRRRRARVAVPRLMPPQPVPLEKMPLREEFAPKSLIAAVNAEPDHASKVRKSFRLAQALIDRRIQEPRRDSETHWEYYDRVSKRAPQIKDTLKRLVELFEVTEYGPDPAEGTHTHQATEILLKLREEVEAVE